jgi:chemotaxis protein MotB
MARRQKHEEHANHEAWAIPYGDLITLLLAFFVVMYAISSINEGKYRVVADSMAEAFGGSPRPVASVPLTEALRNTAQPVDASMMPVGQMSDSDFGSQRRQLAHAGGPVGPLAQLAQLQRAAQAQREAERLRNIARQIETSMAELIDRDLVTVRRTEFWIEIEIKSDVLFGSGSADIAATALPTLAQVGAILKDFPNPVEVEGHTDDLPIASAVFPSNWELSAARAASVVKLLIAEGIAARRLSVIGYGAERPKVANANAADRASNRRVVLAVTAMPLGAEPAEPDAAAASPSPVTAAAAARNGIEAG